MDMLLANHLGHPLIDKKQRHGVIASLAPANHRQPLGTRVRFDDPKVLTLVSCMVMLNCAANLFFNVARQDDGVCHWVVKRRSSQLGRVCRDLIPVINGR
jgi:hypothetical protein